MVKDHTHDKPDFYNDLDKTYENIWDQLIIGKSKSKSELHQGYISTFNDSFPSVRTVVLRHVDKKNNTISFHTDIRSSKIDEIKKKTYAWQGLRDSNPRPSVLETDALPTELNPCEHQITIN